MVPVGNDIFAEGLLCSCMRFIMKRHDAGHDIGLSAWNDRQIRRLCRRMEGFGSTNDVLFWYEDSEDRDRAFKERRVTFGMFI